MALTRISERSSYLRQSVNPNIAVDKRELGGLACIRSEGDRCMFGRICTFGLVAVRNLSPLDFHLVLKA